MSLLIRLKAAVSLLLLFAVSLAAQTQGVDILLSKARSLEARGRMDLAAQNWKQALLVNPNQTEALAGLARYAKQNGESDEERSYLERLRKINPKAPEIAAIEKMRLLTPQERDRLDQAGRLALEHKPEEAMKIYNQIFGNQPPYGKWAEPYYQTEAATSGGREKAIAQLRRLTAHDPSNEIYRLWLARVLIYQPKTRSEGLGLLESIHDPGAVEQARTEWRQALVWEKENPAVLPHLKAYLERYPDAELQPVEQFLGEKQERAAEEATKEQGFQALEKRNMSTAEGDFEKVLERSPNDPNAVAGLAFVRLNQKRFDEAVSLFERARSLAPKRADVRQGYETAKFWSFMQQGSSALERHQPAPAITAFQEALALRPGDEQAHLGMAQAELRDNRLPDAETEFAQVLNQSPNNTDAIVGLAFIHLQQKKFDDAVGLFDKARKLAPNRADVEQGYRDAKYWSLMQRGATALDQKRAAEALSDYREALTLRPGASDALHGLAGAAERTGDYRDVVQAYSQLTLANSSEAENWLRLIQASIAAHDPKQALATAQRIPPTVQSKLETRPDYLSQVALAYYEAKQPDEGSRMLRKAMDAARSGETTEAVNARLMVASELMEQGRTDAALAVYRQAAELHPDNVIAWQGLVGAYARTRDYAQAKTAVRSMPQGTYQLAANSPDFLSSMAAIYAADGECGQAEDFLNRSLSFDRARGRHPAEHTELQLADLWLREGNWEKARNGYRQILSSNQNSPEAWRGYFVALHEGKNDKDVVAESQRMPASVRAQLEKDASFLTLLAGARSVLGDYANSVPLLEKARAVYVSENHLPPAELDLQLAWAMVTSGQSDPRTFFEQVKARKDLSEKQRATMDQIWSIWSVRTAEQALNNKKPEQAIAILTDAERLLPSNRLIYGELASVYMREHNYHKALAVYESWGLTGAEAQDYRAAVGAATGAHRDDLVEFYLNQGLRRFPTDADLLEIKGKQAIAQGNYKVGQNYLKSALRATQHPDLENQVFSDGATLGQGSVGVQTGSELNSMPAATSQTPVCHETTSFKMPNDLHLKLVSTRDDSDEKTQSDGERNQGSSGTRAQSNGNQSRRTQAPVAAREDPRDDTVRIQSDGERTEQLQDEIDVVQNRNAPFGDTGNTASGRAGDPGIDRLIIEDGSVGGSITGADTVRVSVAAHGIYAFSGTPNGQSKSRFGTLLPGATFGRQSSGGIAGDLQISTSTFGLDFGSTPQGFPVQNLIGGLRFRPLGGPITFLAVRDSVKDSLLSYAGVRDPGTGIVWGGVVSNTGTVEIEHKTRRAGQYGSVSFSYLTGKNVPDNWDASGNAGFYFVVVKGLSVGLSVTGMHYDKNLSFLSLGHGGYFSPQKYALGSIPISWFSRHNRFEYEIRASLGAQYFSQDSALLFPGRVNGALPTQGFYRSNTDIGPNYYFLARLGYRVAPHVYFDTFATASNSRNYATQTVGFSLKFITRRLPTNTDLHVNSIPDWRGNQPFGIE